MADFHERMHQDVCTLHVVGEVDIASADGFRDRMMECLGRSGALEVDLGEVTFMDSSGLSALVWAHKEGMGSGKNVSLVNPSSITARLLEVTGLAEVFDVKPSRN